MSELISYLPNYVYGLSYTLMISLLSIIGGGVLGFTFNFFRLTFSWFYIPYRFYIWLIRGTPFLAQLFVIYFGLASIGIVLTAIEATIVGLTFYSAAYFAEIFRSAWQSINKGQLEAAGILGITNYNCFWYIQVPQAIRFCLPILANQIILIIKESSVASIITVPELTMTAGRVVSETYNYITPYLLLIISYWILTQSISSILNYINIYLFEDRK